MVESKSETIKTITGKIEELNPMNSENPKAPIGQIKIKGLYLTTWNKECFESLSVGEEVTIDYKEIVNGKWTNNNVIDVAKNGQTTLMTSTNPVIVSKDNKLVTEIKVQDKIEDQALICINGVLYKFTKLEKLL